jgi:hypothetical protein
MRGMMIVYNPDGGAPGRRPVDLGLSFALSLAGPYTLDNAFEHTCAFDNAIEHISSELRPTVFICTRLFRIALETESRHRRSNGHSASRLVRKFLMSLSCGPRTSRTSSLSSSSSAFASAIVSHGAGTSVDRIRACEHPGRTLADVDLSGAGAKSARKFELPAEGRSDA